MSPYAQDDDDQDDDGGAAWRAAWRVSGAGTRTYYGLSRADVEQLLAMTPAERGEDEDGAA